MARKPVLVQLSDELLARLDSLADQRGISRSSMVRDAVERYITQESDAARDEQLRAGYARIPDDASLDRWAAGSVADMLDEEAW